MKELDNPVWNALKGSQIDFAVKTGNGLFYDPKYCAFGAFDNEANDEYSIDFYATMVNDFYVVGNKPRFSNHVLLNRELVCNQMILERRIEEESTTQIHLLNTEDQRQELFNLVHLVMPGFIKSNTYDLGNYFGIYFEGELVAVTGERMRLRDCVEISAVVVHPHHNGKGYAKQLVSHTANKIFENGKLPFLHVANYNEKAISLYEKLGFKTRREMSFWHIQGKV